jgi:hypothetical protein
LVASTDPPLLKSVVVGITEMREACEETMVKSMQRRRRYGTDATCGLFPFVTMTAKARTSLTMAHRQ